MDKLSIWTEKPKPDKKFQSVTGIIFSCLGCVIGTGNIWRFPRIVARNSGSEGAACFFIVWGVCLFTWSIPLLVIEYAIGRYTHVSPIRCFVRFMGKIGLFMGGWVTFINFFIGSYYMVILGWCLYYVYLPMAVNLPSEENESQKIFDSFVQSNWSFIPYTLCFILIALSVIGGIKVIEKVNIVLVPALLIILLGIFFYSTTVKYSEHGFSFLFSADWKTLTKPNIYLDAISQNAFDTGAAGGLITTYATYLTRSNSIMRYSLFVPIINNLVSFLASMTIFPAVFGLMLHKNPTMTRHSILSVIKSGGMAGTGLTFIWIPILLETLGLLGKILCSVFFICLSFAGISSIISCIELQTITLMDFGVKRKLSVIIISVCMFLCGSGSVLNLNFLVNQDTVWGFSLIVSGLLYIILVIRYGPLNFRSHIVNKEKFKYDFNLPYIWVIIITVLAPLQAISMIVWWIYSDISEKSTTWYIPGWNSLMTTWIEWVIFAVLLVIASVLIQKLNLSWIKEQIVPKTNDFPMLNPVFRSNHENKIQSESVSYIEPEYGNPALNVTQSEYDNPRFYDDDEEVQPKSTFQYQRHSRFF